MIVSEIGTEEKVLTLRELCQLLNISRRTVQGYEAQGLIAPTHRAPCSRLSLKCGLRSFGRRAET